MQYRIFKTESFRLSAIFVTLLVGAMLLLMGVVYVIVNQAFRTELLAAADRDIASVQKALDTEGIQEAKEVVAQLLVKSPAPSFFVLESKSAGKLAGNLPALAPKTGEQMIPMPAGFSRDPDVGEEHHIIGRGVFLTDDIYAFAGRDLTVANGTKEDILNAFVWVLAVTLALALAGGIFLSNAFLGRMDAITKTCREIIGGNLDERIPERGTRDELDRLVMTINTMLDRIGALMENVRQISSDIAHDLRTPLTRLRHHLELARGESLSVQEYDRALDRAISDSDNILTTFSALLRIGQIEGRANPATRDNVDLSELLEQMVEMYKPVAEDAEYLLNGTVAPGIAIQGDRELLSQLFANLIENAMMHTPQGSTISVRLETIDGKAMASVSDNGSGIPADERDKVLRRFYRLERARSRPGNGLGLSLVAALVDYHDATLTLADNVPGLRVVVTFPDASID